MARISVERQPRGAGRWWLLAALVVVGLLVFALFSDRRGDQPPEAALYDPDRPVAAIAYAGERWVPEGRPMAVSHRDTIQIGESERGHDLFVIREDRYTDGGGGGGELTRVYMRTTEGTYQPFVRQR